MRFRTKRRSLMWVLGTDWTLKFIWQELHSFEFHCGLLIMLDQGYHPDKLEQELKKVYPQIMRKIKFELSPKPSKAEKAAAGQIGFVPVAVRWVVERSNAWMERCKSLVKNFERTLSNATAQLNLCFIRLMLKRLAAPS